MSPLVKERLEQEALHGKDWPDRPVRLSTMTPFTSFPKQNDALTWLIENLDGKEYCARNNSVDARDQLRVYPHIDNCKEIYHYSRWFYLSLR